MKSHGHRRLGNHHPQRVGTDGCLHLLDGGAHQGVVGRGPRFPARKHEYCRIEAGIVAQFIAQPTSDSLSVDQWTAKSLKPALVDAFGLCQRVVDDDHGGGGFTLHDQALGHHARKFGVRGAVLDLTNDGALQRWIKRRSKLERARELSCA